ncbi:hypothetical protein GX50_03720 [[Emmonsia] crescens]|uniref:Uncharacterized protein n=1 Tax=[Emmonsia] crescens TaxID=73230 RepID=A0A2B7ZIM2_9EURO|nr:hypothetical protein GX50_03720 [Emmonsia crescens]
MKKRMKRTTENERGWKKGKKGETGEDDAGRGTTRLRQKVEVEVEVENE